MRQADILLARLRNIFAVAAADGNLNEVKREIFWAFAQELGSEELGKTDEYFYSILIGEAKLHKGRAILVEDFNFQTYPLYIPDNEEERINIFRSMVLILFAEASLTRPTYEVCKRYMIEANLSESAYLAVFAEISQNHIVTQAELEDLEKDIWLDKNLYHLRLLDQACIKSDLKKYEEALKLNNIILQENENDSELLKLVYNNCAFYHYCLQQYELAMIHINKALEIDPKYALAIHTRAEILVDLEAYEEALNCMNMVIQFEPDNQAAIDFRETIKRKMKS